MENIQNKEKKEIDCEITIKLQTLDNIYTISINKNLTIQDLKAKISENFNIAATRQKIIYQGKILKNTDKISACKIQDESVVHLLVKPADEQPNPQSQPRSHSTENTTSENLEGSNRFPIGGEDMLNSVIEIPIIRSSRRRRRRQNMTFDISESFESLHQNIVTIQNILNCKVKYDDLSVAKNMTIVPYDLSRMKYEPGQWLDAKDTIDQWIEAQVVHVSNNQGYIHYNGWGTRWDEWIDFTSPRLAPFKTYCISNDPGGCYSSPYPAIVPDASIEPLQRNLDTFYYLDKASIFINEVTKGIDNINKCRKKSKFNKLEAQESGNLSNFSLNSTDLELLHNAAQLVPIMDRVGRFLSDVSLHLSNLILSPRLYPQLVLGYNHINAEDNLSCTSGYSMYTNEGSNISGLNINQDHNIINNLQRNNLQNTNQIIYNYANQIQHNVNPQSSTNQESTTTKVNTSSIINVNNNSYIHQSYIYEQFINSLPKINLQLPAIHHKNLTHNAYSEPNIDIYVHTLVAPQNQNSQSNLTQVVQQPNAQSQVGNVARNSNTNANTNIPNNLSTIQLENNALNTSTNEKQNEKNSVKSDSNNRNHPMRLNSIGVQTNKKNNSRSSSTSKENLNYINAEIVSKNLGNNSSTINNMHSLLTNNSRPNNLDLNKDTQSISSVSSNPQSVASSMKLNQTQLSNDPFHILSGGKEKE